MSHRLSTPINPDDKMPGETNEQSVSRQRDEAERKAMGEQLSNMGMGNNTSTPSIPMPDSDTGSYEPVKLSNTALYVGIPLLILAYLVWRDYLPFSDVQPFGIPLASLLFGAGILCVAFRFVAKLAAVGLVIAGGIMGLGTLTAMVGGETLSSLTGNFLMAGAAIVIGVVLFRVVSKKK